jgi:LuxR family transcriptional regulator, regulator of acetate metabolism
MASRPAVELPSDSRWVDALARLDELGSSREILKHAAVSAAFALELDRVLLSRFDAGRLFAESLHAPSWTRPSADALIELRAQPVSIEYPCIEGEVLRRRRPQIVRRAPSDPITRNAYATVMDWHEYVTAPIRLEGHVVGFLQGDRLGDGPPLDDRDATQMGAFVMWFAIVYERSILRERLRIQRQEMRHVTSWLAGRTSELSDRSITLTPDGIEAAPDGGRSGAASDGALRDLLTPRELEVLELMVQGRTNGEIAREFVVSQGTVKFHVKNILRKLHASNRAEATSRYLRLTLGHGA